jgi:hypothetical protein
MTTHATFHVENDDVRKMLHDLLMRDIVVTPHHRPARFRTRNPGTLAVFRSANGDHVGACWCDLSLANIVGAALSLMPPNVAKEATAKGEISELVLENLAEVMNVGSHLWVEQAHGAVSLERVFRLPSDEVPEAVINFYKDSERKFEFGIEVKGYGTGVIQLAA